MEVYAERLTDHQIFLNACAATLPPGARTAVSERAMFKCEHSPIRVIRYWIYLSGVKSFVSTHLVRHKHGVEHFVQSNRDDRGGDPDTNRNTPVNHAMDINAQALIQISRKRLCLKSHPETVGTWTRVRKAIREIDPVMADCTYRAGLCPELRCCDPGPERVSEAYPAWGGMHHGV